MFMLQGSDCRGLTLDRKCLHDQDFFSVVHENNVTSGYIKINPGSHTIGHSSEHVPYSLWSDFVRIIRISSRADVYSYKAGV